MPAGNRPYLYLFSRAKLKLQRCYKSQLKPLLHALIILAQTVIKPLDFVQECLVGNEGVTE